MSSITGYAPPPTSRCISRFTAPPSPAFVRPLLIHDGGNTIESNWQHFIPLVMPSRQVVAVEEEDHGRSAVTKRELGSDPSARDVAALLAHLGIERADAMGKLLEKFPPGARSR